MNTFKQFVESTVTSNGSSAVKKIYVTQKENDRYFDQKLSTSRNGFTYINRKITFEADPNDVYSEGEWGYITVSGKKIYVNGDGEKFEIYGLKR